jgi:hypothetical protein
MPDSKRLTMLKALTAHLETDITASTLNGYSLTGKVYRGVMNLDDRRGLPCLSILDNPDPDRYPRRVGGDTYDSQLQRDDYILLIQGWVNDDIDNPTDPAHKLMADVKQSLAKIANDRNYDVTGIPNHPNYHLGNLIAGMTMEPGTVRPPMEQLSNKAFFWMRIVVKFVENPNDPYDLA